MQKPTKSQLIKAYIFIFISIIAVGFLSYNLIKSFTSTDSTDLIQSYCEYKGYSNYTLILREYYCINYDNTFNYSKINFSEALIYKKLFIENEK